MANKLMYIPNDDPQKQTYYRFKLNEATNQDSVKVPKVVKSSNKKTVSYNFGDQCEKPKTLGTFIEFIWIFWKNFGQVLFSITTLFYKLWVLLLKHVPMIYRQTGGQIDIILL